MRWRLMSGVRGGGRSDEDSHVLRNFLFGGTDRSGATCLLNV
jgi:hypothetical protein